MTNHQKLQLIRHLKRAEGTYQDLYGSNPGPTSLRVLEDCRKTLDWVRAMKTSDDAIALNIRDEAMAPAHPGRV